MAALHLHRAGSGLARRLPGGAPLWAVIWGRLVREGGENCLPFSEIGGLVFGARALMLEGVALPRAAASSIVDVINEGMRLVPFVPLGLVVLMARGRHQPLVWPRAGGLVLLLLLAVAVAVAVAAYVARTKLSWLLRWGGTKLLRPWTKNAPAQAKALQGEVEGLFAARGRIAIGAGVHFLAWCGGAGNVWIAYHLLGAKVSVVTAFGVESLISSVLAVGFLVPGALGIQEVSYMTLGRVFGVPVHLSLALSLIRGARDILIGAPAIGLWQWQEALHLRQGGTA